MGWVMKRNNVIETKFSSKLLHSIQVLVQKIWNTNLLGDFSKTHDMTASKNKSLL